MHTGQDPIVAHFVILELLIRIILYVYVSQLVVTLEQLALNLCGYMWLLLCFLFLFVLLFYFITIIKQV